MKLFANAPEVVKSGSKEKEVKNHEVASEGSSEESDHAGEESDEEEDSERGTAKSVPLSFEEIGLSEWVCKSVAAMGYRQPTPVQQKCIPAILAGHDVIGCAETGSGKTAAFALPILHHLSKDPYGVFAVILTPTRELAAQISEQFVAFGAPIGLRISLIIGGMGMTDQALALKKLPHIVIATPGRLRAHLEGPDPPSLARTPYLVLDEADRLLAQGFSAELNVILGAMTHKKRRTFLFSATMTESLVEVEKFAMQSTLRFDLTQGQRVPAQLVQQYLFMPQQVKMNYLVAVLNKVVKAVSDADDKDEGDFTEGLLLGDGRKGGGSKGHDKKKGKGGKYGKGGGRRQNPEDVVLELAHKKPGDDDDDERKYSSSMIIFAGTCRRCQETHEVLRTLGYNSVVLHSMMSQHDRTQSLSSFKNHRSRILIATDVASRGLDIPEVDLVVNMDLPRVAEDYIHRVGRTARAGKAGRALALITQYDVDMLHGIEEYMGIKLVASDEVAEDEVVPLLNVVSKATRMAQMKLLESGFDEKYDGRKGQKQDKAKSKRRAAAAAAAGDGSSSSSGDGGDQKNNNKRAKKDGGSGSGVGSSSRDGKQQQQRKEKVVKKVKAGKGIGRSEEMSNVMRM
jgi:ATP-dependent RNA helicase DDX49/DBP8